MAIRKHIASFLRRKLKPATAKAREEIRVSGADYEAVCLESASEWQERRARGCPCAGCCAIKKNDADAAAAEPGKAAVAAPTPEHQLPFNKHAAHIARAERLLVTQPISHRQVSGGPARRTRFVEHLGGADTHVDEDVGFSEHPSTD